MNATDRHISKIKKIKSSPTYDIRVMHYQVDKYDSELCEKLETEINKIDKAIEAKNKEIERLKEKLELLYVQSLHAIGDLGHAMRTASPEHKLAISQELEEKHDSIIKKTVQGEF